MQAGDWGPVADEPWVVTDELWQELGPILQQYDPPKLTGRRRAEPRAILAGVLYRLHTRCCWNRLPRDFGDDSTVHRTFQRWQRSGAWDHVRRELDRHGQRVPDA